MDKWYLKDGKDDDIVFSTRIRFARNIADFPFPNKMTDEQKFAVIQIVSDSIFKSEIGKDYRFVDVNSLDTNSLFSLVERHLISPQFAKNTGGRALILKNDESVSVMINEEDHIRIQSVRSGLEFQAAFIDAVKLEKIIGKTVNYAFDSSFGYLTECPTNVGTGMRASAMLHLPALEKLNLLQRIFNSVSKYSVAVRGTFGEGSKANSSMYQISNQITLGISEEDSIENIESIIKEIVKKENEAREAFDRQKLEDSVYRAVGTLKFARLISTNEFFELISEVRLGVSMKILNIPIKAVNELSLLCGRANISGITENNSNPNVRDRQRANFIREKIEKYI